MGWLVASDGDWTIFTTFLGGATVAGGKLKEAGLTHWIDPNRGATNETGFTALPGGQRKNDGTFNNIGKFGYWWTTYEFELGAGGNYIMYNDKAVMGNYFPWQNGFSVRCVKIP
jgi:uncharacterized protein (TIGR02145 family)